MLNSWIKAKNLDSQGPLIMYSSSISGVDADGKSLVDSRIMIQLKQDGIQLELPYRFEKEIRREKCLFARFNDNSENFQFATMKLQLFAYENDIELTGETYVVFIKEEENILLADVFIPIKANEIQGKYWGHGK